MKPNKNTTFLSLVFFVASSLFAQNNKEMGVYYSPWHPLVWNCVWGEPQLGQYDCKDNSIIDQHTEWLVDAHFDFVIMDWSNNCDQTFNFNTNQFIPSDQQSAWGIYMIEYNAVAFTDRQVWRKNNGLPYVKVGIFLGGCGYDDNFTNGVIWDKAEQIKRQFIDNTERNSVYYYRHGKPFLGIWGPPYVTPGFSHDAFLCQKITTELGRYNTSFNKKDYWSWEETRLILGYSLYNDQPECMTILAASRGSGVMKPGWLITEADGVDNPMIPRRNGRTFQESFDIALDVGVEVILVQSFNEWVGCPDNPGEEMDQERSNDIEPMAGGHGRLYMDIAKANGEVHKGLITCSASGNNNGSGLQAIYFNDVNFSNQVLQRVESNMDMQWGSYSPDPAINADNFSVKLEGQIEAPYDGTYIFYSHADDENTLWINGQQILSGNIWNLQNNGAIYLNGGQKYNITWEIIENTGGASATLEWSSGCLPREVVPASRLYAGTCQPQTITFNSLPDKLTSDAPFSLNATASSGLSVSYSILSGPASISGNTVTLTGTSGTVTIVAKQTGDNTWCVANEVQQSFDVNPTQSPYGGTPQSIPGTIQAENYDEGGEGLAYHDSGAGNTGGEYRSDDVDIEICSEGGYNIGWTAADEWLEYTVNVSQAGSYDVDLRVAALNAGSMIRIEFDGVDKTGTVDIPSTGSWESFTTVSSQVNLDAGEQIMRVYIISGELNLNFIEYGITITTNNSIHSEKKTPAIVSIFPNPVEQGELNIAFNTQDLNSIKISIINNLGQDVTASVGKQIQKQRTITLNLEQLPAGLYGIRMTHNHGIIDKKIMKL